jgi:phosphoribosyl 1,2-cyclic phosphodiesterase
MEISVIASGSNGNCCLVEEKDVSLLIDAGKSGSEIEMRMDSLGKSMENVNAVLLTHAHHDHLSGAGVLSRRYDVPIYMTKDVFSDV